MSTPLLSTCNAYELNMPTPWRQDLYTPSERLLREIEISRFGYSIFIIDIFSLNMSTLVQIDMSTLHLTCQHVNAFALNMSTPLHLTC